MAQISQPCASCGATVLRTGLHGKIRRYCGDACKPRCAVDGCSKPVRALGWCASHYRHSRRNDGDPTAPFAWRHGEGGYDAVHHRLRIYRGPARDQACVDCGSPADEWSYDHRDLNELVNENVRESQFSVRPFFFSRNLSHYEPRCVPCHRVFDRQFAAP